MTDHLLWVDGNALAGALGEALGGEMTSVPRGCQSCGQVHPIGAHRAYRGAGVVLRCPNCGDVALRLVQRDDRMVLSLAGTWRLEMPQPQPR
jgi:predicted RNA-binding Zn-ribbon protein involved in translation (DUF1610 family)